jgi:hypothetical protein
MKNILNKLNSNWKQKNENNKLDEQFVDKAVDSLFKKLKTKKDAIEDLEYAINNPNSQSKCVTITRSLDGRLQVSHRKGLPHVIYCRIFRWPDLQSHHELKTIGSHLCQFTFNAKKSEICINPYHYERCSDSLSLNEMSPPSKMQKLEADSNFPRRNEIIASHIQLPPSVGSPLNQNFIYNGQQMLDYTVKEKENELMMMNFNYNHQNNHQYGYQNQFNNDNLSFYNNSNMNSSSPPYQTVQPPLTLQTIPLQSQPSASHNFLPSIEMNNNVLTSPTSSLIHSSSSSNSSSTDQWSSIDETSYQMVSYQEPLHWCSIVYYEMNMRVGETFNANYNEIYIDGYTDPSNNWGRRCCLGMFTNVNRTQSTQNVRKNIGRGVAIYNDNGDVYIECLSNSPVFIQSKNYNYDKGLHPNTVVKLEPTFRLRVFQSRTFAELLKESVNKGYDAVYDLSAMCTIRLSFIKGWGSVDNSNYYRHDVSSCPSWCEIRLNGSFQWLDKVLKEMGSSSNPVTSIS